MKEPKNEYGNYFKNSMFIMFLINFESMKIEDANYAACQFYQYSFEQIINLNITDLIMLTQEEIKSVFNRAENKFYCKHKNSVGLIKDMEVYFEIIEVERKKFFHLTAHEIADSVNRELINYEKWIEYLLDGTEAILFQVDQNGIYKSFKCGDHVKNVDSSKIIGNSIFDIHKDNIQGIENIKKALEGKRFRSEVSHAGYIHDVMYSPVSNNDNEIIGAYGVAINITEKKKIENSKVETEKKYKDLYNHMELGYACYKIITDEQQIPINYTIVEINPAYEKITGLSRENLIGRDATELFPNIKKSSVDWISIFGKVALTGESVSMEVYSDIMKRWYNVHYFSPSFGFTSCVFSDITKRIEMEEGLRHQKELLKIIIDSIPDPLSIYDKENNLIQMNKARRKLYEGRELKDILLSENEYQFLDLEGNEISPEDIPTRRALKGEYVNGAIVVVKMPDKEKITEVSAAPIFDDNNNVNYYVVVHRDITEKMEIENLIKSQQLKIIEVEKEKNATLNLALQMKDEFISLISHELRTPLTVISATLQTLEIVSKNEFSDKTNRYLVKVKQNTNRLIKLINNLLDNTRANSGYFNINKTNIDIIDLNKKIIESILPFAEKKDIRLTFCTDLESKVIGVDAELYERIILNLLSNAVKFTPGNKGKSIRVIVSDIIIKNQEMIKIQVVDEGIGIPEDKKNLIFEKFGQVNNVFTRNEEGTGIGLSLVKMIVELMGGEIILETEEGSGSTFSVILPATTVDFTTENFIGRVPEERILRAASIEFSDI